MRLIDADEIMKALSIFNDTTNGNSHFINGIETAKELIEDAPTVDPIKVADKQKRYGGFVLLMTEEDREKMLDNIIDSIRLLLESYNPPNDAQVELFISPGPIRTEVAIRFNTDKEVIVKCHRLSGF